MQNKTSLVVTIIVVGIIGLLVGYFVGVDQGKKSVADEYGQKLQEVAGQALPPGAELRNVSGEVTAINGNVVTIKSDNSQYPIDNLPATREITVGENTMITKAVRLSDEEIQKVIEAANGAPVSLQDRQVAGVLSDIKIGGVLNVTAEKDIKMNEKFEAATIYILPPQAQPAVSGASSGTN